MTELKSWVRGGNSKGELGYWLEFDYNPTIIEQIKKTIPSRFREWDDKNKRWWISELCEPQINYIFKGFIEAVVAQRRLL